MRYAVLVSSLLLGGCLSTGANFMAPEQPDQWSAYQSGIVAQADVKALGHWWEKFNDPTLNQLVLMSLDGSPERRIAEARILEARGIRKTAASSLFPEIGASANAGRQDNGISSAADYYEAKFDASYELDLFGKNRKTVSAADENIRALEAQYHNVTLSLIGEIARDYIDYRLYEKQTAIAEENLQVQEKTLELVKYQKEFGDAPQLDVERAENLVNTTRSSIPEFKRQAENARLRLSVLTGQLPEKIRAMLSFGAPIPGADVQPVIMAPADVIALRPDIRAAAANLRASTSLKEATTADLFPKVTLGGFFGVAKGALFSSTSIWNVAAGAAVSILNFGRIQGQIDAAQAIQMRAYEAYRLSVLQAVTDVETALSDYAHIHEQSIHLENAYNNAKRAFDLSKTLYGEGEISFLDVLVAQKTLNDADSARAKAEAAQSQSLIRLYKSLGVY